MVAAVIEPVNAAVFEKTPDRRHHADFVGYAGQARHQRAGAAHDQLDLDPGLRCSVQRGDDLGFEQRVHLGDDAPALAGPGPRRLRVDCKNDVFVQGERGLPDMRQLAHLGQAGQLPKHLVDIAGERFIGGEHAKIGVQARGARVIVAGAEVRIALELALLPAHHQDHLGVGLVADHAVDHVRADCLQLRRPVDIGFLLETRHQFDHYRDFLAAARRFHQQVHQFGLGAGAIDGLLDRDHRGVGGGRAQEVEHRIEGLERMVQENVARRDAGEHLVGFSQQHRVGGLKRRELEVGALNHVRQLHQPGQVHRTIGAEQVGFFKFKLLQQESDHIRRTVAIDFEAHRVAEMPLRQFALQGQLEVGHLFLIDEQVAVAGDAKRVAGTYREAGKQLADEANQQG